jgi:hypothetical protein
MIESPRYGGCSSMAECLTVDQDVAGSTPVSHPQTIVRNPIKDQKYPFNAWCFYLIKGVN